MGKELGPGKRLLQSLW